MVNTWNTAPTFTSSDGKLVMPLGISVDVVSGVTLQADGTILVGVTGHSYSGSTHGFAIIQLSSDGSVDATFDTDGKAQATLPTNIDVATTIALQSDSRVIVGGIAY